MKRISCSLPLGRCWRIAVVGMLALSLLPVAAFGDEASSGLSFAERVVLSNERMFAEFEATGDERVLFNRNAYDYPDNAVAPLANDVLPSSYSLVDKGVVTPVKLQNPWGTCWAFGATAASETSILSELGTTYDQFPLDLSERHLAWMTKTPLADGSSQDGEGIHTTSLDPSIVMNQGGRPFEATSIYSSGIGPIPESVVPYRNDEGIVATGGEYYSSGGTWAVDESLRFGQAYRLEESSILPSPANNGPGVAVMKQELLAGRAVEICFAADQSMPGQESSAQYLNTKDNTWAHYTYEDVSMTHAVCVVGYDDSYSKENFLAEHQPPGDGAWLVKNSWGAADQEFPNKRSWGVDGKGYFWLSYYDRSIDLAETFDFDTTDPLNGEADYWLVNQYDYMPTLSAKVQPFTDLASMANVFMAGERMNVTAVSSETVAPGTVATYEVYLLDDGYADPKDGRRVASFQKTYAYGGYHREQLDQPFTVAEGQDYSVVVTLQVPGGYEVPLQYNVSKEGMEYTNTILPEGQKLTRYAEGIVNEGESYLYADGKWEDWTKIIDEMYSMGGAALYTAYDNFAIKAYGDPAPAPKATVPDLAGKTEAEALAALEAAGLKGVADEAEYSDVVEAGCVIRQDVAAGTEVDEGSSVAYILSLGKKATVLPPPIDENAVGGSDKSALARTGDPLAATVSLVAVAGLVAAGAAVAARRRRER